RAWEGVLREAHQLPGDAANALHRRLWRLPREARQRYDASLRAAVHGSRGRQRALLTRPHWTTWDDRRGDVLPVWRRRQAGLPDQPCRGRGRRHGRERGRTRGTGDLARPVRRGYPRDAGRIRVRERPYRDVPDRRDPRSDQLAERREARQVAPRRRGSAASPSLSSLLLRASRTRARGRIELPAQTLVEE